MATSSSSTTSSSSRLGSASPSTSVICQEVFDDSCQPSEEEINDYAVLLGIDPVKEPHLLYLAKEGLMQALPGDWKICYSELKCGHYYYNLKTKTSQWEHPLDDVYHNLVEQARQKHYNTTNTTTIQNTTNVIITSTALNTNTTTTAIPTTTAIGVDYSDDASQLDSGIRSLQGTDECDNTTNTNTLEMSSPSTTQITQGAIPKQTNSLGGCLNTNNSSSTSNTPSGFSGGVSRFLESRTKNFGSSFMPVKNTRFEVAKTNPQLGFSMRLANDNPMQKFPLVNKQQPELDGPNVNEKKGFTLSGTGAMFLKSRRQLEQGLNQASNIITNPHNIVNSSSNIIVEGLAGTPPGVKGILRDSSLTDMRRRMEKDQDTADLADDKKRVHFNLEECAKMRLSPEEDPSSSRKLTQSPEISANSDDEAEDDDPWDDDEDGDGEELNDCVGIGSLPLDGLSYQRSLNPFLINDDKHLKEVKVIPVSKTQTIQMLKAQSFSMDLPEREKAKVADLPRSQSIEHSPSSNNSAQQYLDKLKDSAAIKPLYEDTDSDSKGSSVRSFIINKSEQDSLHSTGPSNNPFDLDELDRKHSHEVEQLEMKLQAVNTEKSTVRSLKVASKLVSFLKKDVDRASDKNKDQDKEKAPEHLKEKLEKEKQLWLTEEREQLEQQLQNEIDMIKKEHDQKLKSIRHEYDLRLTSHRHQMEEAIELQIDEIRSQLEEELDAKRKSVVEEHKDQMCTLQKNHAEILEDLERDLKSEEEILKKEHALKLNEMKDKLNHELEMERQRMRDTGEDRLYEKVRCEKRLLEDKYRCLKEKYIRLKTDVKLSLERRNRRREAQALQQQSLHTCTTGSETERSISNKPSIGNSDNRSLSYSTSCQNSVGVSATNTGKNGKPPLPPKTHLHAANKEPLQQQQQQHYLERGNDKGPVIAPRKPGIASKYIKHLQAQDDTTSMSQSDTTISNNYSKGRYLPAPQPILSDNGNSDSEAFQSNQENNNNSRGGGGVQRKKQFSRLKSASTSRLNNSENFKSDRPCTPVENLRHQLQKLEDLEDQFPENTLDATYHLRYPFSDISNADYAAAGAASSELEFFKHRIHLERDSVRRAKESLRTQRTNFRARQREIKQRHKAMVSRHSLDQLIQEEKELTEMEVNLHRTRALLGEKVIRLRHLEQSLLRIYEKEKPSMDLLGVEQKEDATLSDLSSHSSSGFSSTDFASGDTQNLNKRKDLYQLESNDCIKNLEILNAEIREILDLLGKSGQHGAPMISPSELNWSHMLSSGSVAANNPASAHSIPTLADRLETYRKLATGRMQNSIIAANTIVSQNPRAVSYTTSLVERTRDLRNWLRQAKNEHELLSSMTLGLTGVHAGNQLTANATLGASSSGAGGGGGTQTNL